MDERIRLDLQHGVADVRLVRAAKMNALDDAMFDALRRTGEQLKTLPGVRAAGRFAPGWTPPISARWPAAVAPASGCCKGNARPAAQTRRNTR